MPPILLVVGYLGFAGYGLWCAFARNVDPGVGEAGRVPLGSGYELDIGSNDEGSVRSMSPAHETLGLAIPRLGFDDHAVYFETERDKFRLIEKANGHIGRGLSEAELAAKLRSLGSSEVRLRPPKQVYMSLRWGSLDLLAIPMVLGVPAILVFGVASYILKVRRNVQPSGAANLNGRGDR
jgi:hypothetical protein